MGRPQKGRGALRERYHVGAKHESCEDGTLHLDLWRRAFNLCSLTMGGSCSKCPDDCAVQPHDRASALQSIGETCPGFCSGGRLTFYGLSQAALDAACELGSDMNEWENWFNDNLPSLVLKKGEVVPKVQKYEILGHLSSGEWLKNLMALCSEWDDASRELDSTDPKEVAAAEEKSRAVQQEIRQMLIATKIALQQPRPAGGGKARSGSKRTRTRKRAVKRGKAKQSRPRKGTKRHGFRRY